MAADRVENNQMSMVAHSEEINIQVKCDVENLVNEFGKEFTRVSSRKEEPVRGAVHKVPQFLRHRDEDAYTPKLVSIGPYHHGANGLAEMEDIKLKYFQNFTQRSCRPLCDYIVIVEKDVDQLLKAYSTGGLGSDLTKFVKTMVVDCCFVLEFLIRWFVNDRKSQAKTLMNKLPMLMNDLLLVENQIPFFLLYSMFLNFNIQEFTRNDDLRVVALTFFMGDQQDAMLWVIFSPFYGEEFENHYDHLLHLYHEFLTRPYRPAIGWQTSFFPCCSINEPTQDFHRSSRLTSMCINLLRMYRQASDLLKWILKLSCATISRPEAILQWCNLPSCAVVILKWILFILFYPLTCMCWVVTTMLLWITPSPQPKIRFSGIPNACNLRDTGFSFQKKYVKEYNFMDVSRSGNKINIPVLCVRESMLVLFRNLLAFEQCSNKYGCRFTAYAMFMDNLIDTRKDAALLKECGIIDNRLGDDQIVANFFNSLCRDIHLDDDEHYLSTLYNHVMKHYTRSTNKIRFYQWRKKFIPDYFTNPWAIPSMIAALALLALAGLQTFYTVYPYYHPRSTT